MKEESIRVQDDGVGLARANSDNLEVQIEKYMSTSWKDCVTQGPVRRTVWSVLVRDVIHGLQTVVFMTPTYICVGIAIAVLLVLRDLVEDFETSAPHGFVFTFTGVYSLAFYTSTFMLIRISKSSLDPLQFVLALVLGALTTTGCMIFQGRLLNLSLLICSSMGLSFAVWGGSWVLTWLVLKMAKMKGLVFLLAGGIALGTTLNILALSGNAIGILVLPQYEWEISMLYPLIVSVTGRLVVVDIVGFIMCKWLECDQIIITKYLVILTRICNYMVNSMYVVLLKDFTEFLVSMCANTLLEICATWFSLHMTFALAHRHKSSTQIVPDGRNRGKSKESKSVLSMWITDKRTRLTKDAVGFITYLHYCDDFAEKVNSFASAFMAIGFALLKRNDAILEQGFVRVFLFWTLQFFCDLVKGQVRVQYKVFVSEKFDPKVPHLSESIYIGFVVASVACLCFVFEVGANSAMN